MEIGPVLHTELVPVHGVNAAWWGHLVTVDGPQMEEQWESTARMVYHTKKLDTRLDTLLV